LFSMRAKGENISFRHLGDALLSIAGSRSLSELGDSCSHAIASLTGSEALGLYLFDSGRPVLFFSRKAPDGLLEEYDKALYRNDPLLEYVCRKKRPVDGFTLLGSAAWRQCRNFEMLQRWGFNHSMAGPLSADERVVGVMYTSMYNAEHSYQDMAVDNMRLLCEAASIALNHMMSAGKIAISAPRYHHAEVEELRVSAPVRKLPPRSLEVATLLCRGSSIKQIARVLGISPHTVKGHVGVLYERFEAHNRAELVMRMHTIGAFTMTQNSAVL
jgi:DNA-binding CsgD family transcriptional regulator